MSNGESRQEALFLISLAGGALMAGAGLLVAAFKLGASSASPWLVFVFHVLFAVLGAFASFWLGSRLTMWSIKFITFTLGELRHRHSVELKMVKEKSPAILASALLLGDGLLVVADKSFDGEIAPTLSVSMILIVLLWLANNLMASDNRLRKCIGWPLWFLTPVVLILAVAIYRNWEFGSILSSFAALNVGTQVFSLLVPVAMLLLPAAVSWES